MYIQEKSIYIKNKLDKIKQLKKDKNVEFDEDLEDKYILINEQGMKMNEIFPGSYDITNKNGLEKEMTL